MLYLQILLVALKIIEILAVVSLILIAVDLAWYEKTRPREKKATARHRKAEQEKARHRAEKEASATDGFYILPETGMLIYRGARFPTAKAAEYYALMDRRVEDELFENTKEL